MMGGDLPGVGANSLETAQIKPFYLCSREVAESD